MDMDQTGPPYPMSSSSATPSLYCCHCRCHHVAEFFPIDAMASVQTRSNPYTFLVILYPNPIFLHGFTSTPTPCSHKGLPKKPFPLNSCLSLISRLTFQNRISMNSGKTSFFFVIITTALLN